MVHFIVTRNGEHIGENHPTREAAQANIESWKLYDNKLAREGWITATQARATRYSIVERKGRKNA